LLHRSNACVAGLKPIAARFKGLTRPEPWGDNDLRALLLSTAALLAMPAFAQNNIPATSGPDQASPQASAGAAAPNAPAVAEPLPAAENPGEIIVTATRRSQRLSDVPIAVSAVTAESLQNTGATDIRQLNQLSPSLLVSSTSSEAGAGVARIRGIGTVGDNPGLESSVAVFIDGVYRSRTGTGLTELGEIERIEVLRGPQGTLFGRNASAGLINIVTAGPKFEPQGYASATYGNYDFIRVEGGITGGVTDKIALRLDGVYQKRDGFITDVVSGRDLNNRDRWLLRGQVLLEPTDDISIRIIGDYADRKEECCAASINLPIQQNTRDAAGNVTTFIGRNDLVSAFNALGARYQLNNTYDRLTSLTPGRGYQSDVRDQGISGEVNWSFGDATLTSITAYRDWRVLSGQDADFSALDILQRPGNALRQFKTFSQEVRLNGRAFGGALDWLVGGYYAYEKLRVFDNLKYGADYNRAANCILAESLGRTATGVLGIPGFLDPSQSGCINPTAAAAIPDVPALAALRGPARLLSGLTIPGLTGINAVAAAVGRPGDTLVGRGLNDNYRQSSRNYAFFTHNVINLSDQLSLTLGARYTNEEKTLNAVLQSDNTLCTAIRTSPTLAGLAAVPCVINDINGTFNGKKNEDEITGTAVLSFKPVDRVLVYASFSKGYKAGGFNLDRSALLPGATTTNGLLFEPEKVNAYEIGAKIRGRSFNINVAGFYSEFSNFQLNTFNGVNFLVENIQACRTSLNGGDRDAVAATGQCGANDLRSGVKTKGVEVEANVYPVDNFQASAGFTLADTKYQKDLVGFGGRPLPTALALLPGERLSNAPLYVVTASLAWTPPIGDSGLSALFYVDMRYQSEIRTGSDLFPEKTQEGFAVVNGRIGLNGPERRWSIEAWAQNLLNEQFTQVGFNSPLQGGSSLGLVQRGNATFSNTLFSSFLGEPRTYGITVRTRF
jgi:outer membrane receptor protein involved in Fe transport